MFDVIVFRYFRSFDVIKFDVIGVDNFGFDNLKFDKIGLPRQNQTIARNLLVSVFKYVTFY